MIRVKVCGLMTERDLETCIDAGVHALGFVADHPEPVPWNLTRSEAAHLISKVPPFACSCVVTGGNPDDVAETAMSIRPHVLQLHHRETLDDILRVVERLKPEGIRVIKALRIRADGLCDFEIEDPGEAARVLSKTGLSGILVDSFTEDKPGGTGITVDLDTFISVKVNSTVPVILAGGLNPGNIGGIIRAARPFAVDVLSGVEIRPGLKDQRKVREFMKEVARHS
ncbi:MAG TPA: phosphoribosylanthranilate isomerase [Clostridiales bacterium]|nr:phosphoribosylanthranilate isomerase [Clostridiales bacterium]HPV00967.1 phosphoribosylanthranilate isomerase [Clostridiales bacterium]